MVRMPRGTEDPEISLATILFPNPAERGKVSEAASGENNQLRTAKGGLISTQASGSTQANCLGNAVPATHLHMRVRRSNHLGRTDIMGRLYDLAARIVLFHTTYNHTYNHVPCPRTPYRKAMTLRLTITSTPDVTGKLVILPNETKGSFEMLHS